MKALAIGIILIVAALGLGVSYLERGSVPVNGSALRQDAQALDCTSAPVGRSAAINTAARWVASEGFQDISLESADLIDMVEAGRRAFSSDPTGCYWHVSFSGHGDSVGGGPPPPSGIPTMTPDPQQRYVRAEALVDAQTGRISETMLKTAPIVTPHPHFIPFHPYPSPTLSGNSS